MMQIKFFDYNPYNESPLVPPKKLFTQTASFLTIKNLAKSFVPLSLGDPPQNEDIDNNSPGNGVVNIYLQNDAQNLDSINLNQDYDDYDDQIFNPICHSSLINTGNKNSNNLNVTDIPINMKRRKSSSKTKKYEEEIIPKQLLEQSSSISNHNNHNNHNHHNHHSHHHHHALISKRTLRNFSDTDLIKKNNQAAKLAKRMFSIIDIDKSNKRANLSEEDDEENNADDGDKPTLRNLKTMFNASMEDGENINDDNQVPDVKYSTKESTAVIVIQHKDSYHQMNSIKNTDLSALDPICNTPLNGPVAHNETNKIDIISKINDHLLTENQSGTDVDSDYYKDKRRNNTIIRNTIHPFKTKWNEYDNFNVLNLRNKRFGQMYPLPYQYCGFLFPQFKQQWTTFVSPAILPLRNDIEFKQNAMEASKNVYKADWQIGANNKYILNEMILQRLTQDFQLMKVIEHQQQIVNIKTHVLNTQTYIHKLSQTFPDPNITITRYVDDRLAKKENNILLLQNDKINEKNIDVYQQVVTAFSLIYNYNLWNDHREVFQNYSVKLAEQHQLYDWTKLDQVCAGYKNDIENDLKARRIRFAIIPSLSSNSCSYSTLIENFKKWFTTMTNTKNISESGIKINNKDPCYYDASQWTLESNDDNNNDDIDRSRIGFDSMNQILKAKRLIIKLESEWKGRNTFLIIKYDTIYDPNVVFHLQIYWLIATGYQISKFVDSIKRSAKSLSLHLINVPSAQPQKIADPFSKTLTVEAKDGKLLNKTVSIHLQNALISLFNFSLDTNYPNRKQLYFMHNDGCCIVRWNDGKGFTWVPNNAKTADNTQSDFIRSQSIKLFQDFRRYFHDTILKYQHSNDILNNIIQSI